MIKPPLNYDHFVDATWFYTPSKHGSMPELGYVALKLSGECGEILEKIQAGSIVAIDLAKEIGDALFYVIKLSHIFGSNLPGVTALMERQIPEVKGFQELGAQVCIDGGKIAEVVGKAYRDREGEVNRDVVLAMLAKLMFSLERTAALLQLTLYDVQEINIKKLLDRQSRGKMRGSGDDR